ncbi:MAG: hypothetical protein K8Q89_07395 [Nitrosarchaeum sp.]|nr:hypothetical protein [Nitrosarchaeum sp.]
MLLQNGNELSNSQQVTSSDNVRNIFQDFPNSVIAQIDFLINPVKAISSGSSIYDLIGFSIGMVVYGIFVYHFYRFLSKRDMFSINLDQRLSYKKFRSSGEAVSAAPRVAAFIAMNFFIFPFVAFLWFLGYSSIMFLLVHQLPTATIFLVSSALIVAVRISAYYSEDLSRDLAKLLPFALLGIFLYNPQFFSFEDIANRLKEIPSFIVQIASFIVVAMLVEIVLSVLYLIRIQFIHKKEKSKKIDDSETAI